HALRDDVRADLRTILLVKHPQRRLPRSKARDLDRAGKPRQPLLHFALDFGDRHRDVQAAFERAERFECGLHATEILTKSGARDDFRAQLIPRRTLFKKSSLTPWCERGDSNPHGLPRQLLRLVRLPIPPLSRLRWREGSTGRRAFGARATAP